MIEAFTCPHCDAALELPAAAPTQAVLCPCCRGLLPNPNRDEEDQATVGVQPLLAKVVDEEKLRSSDSTQFGCFAGLGLIGAFAASMFIVAAMETFAGRARVTSDGWLAVVATLSLYCFAFILIFQRRPASFIGLAILISFAILGAASVILGVILVGLQIVFASRLV